jgi:hypothetical protein
MAKRRIAETSNTLIPAILALEQAGFVVNMGYAKNGPMFWATRDETTYEGSSPEIVLGLVKLMELRGQDWQASDDEVRAVSERHRLLACLVH